MARVARTSGAAMQESRQGPERRRPRLVRAASRPGAGPVPAERRCPAAAADRRPSVRLFARHADALPAGSPVASRRDPQWDAYVTDGGRAGRPFRDQRMCMEFNLADLFESVADSIPDQPRLVAGDRRLTYAELDGRANRLAHHLEGVGVGPGDRFGAPAGQRHRVPRGHAGVLQDPGRAGQRQLPLRGRGAGLPLRRTPAWSAWSSTAGSGGRWPGALACHAPTAARCWRSTTGPSRRRRAARTTRRPSAASPRPEGSPARGADDLYCVYTGGTTGMPKGVLWRHEDIFFAAMGGGDPLSLGDHVTAPEELVEPGPAARASPPSPSPPSCTPPATGWPSPPCSAGGTVVTLPAGHFDPAEVWRLVEAEQVNALVVVGDAMARPLLDTLAADPDRYDLSSLHGRGVGRRRAVAVDQGAAGRAAARADRRRPLRLLGDRPGRRRAAPGRPLRAAPAAGGRPHRTSSTTTSEPVVPGSGAVGHLARGGHVPLGVPRRPRGVGRDLRGAAGAGGGPCPGTWPRWRPTGPSPSSAAGRCASTPAGRRSSPTRWRRC